MKSRIFRRTPAWLRPDRRARSRGSMSFISFTMAVIFSAIGLGLLSLTRINILTGGFRRNATALEYAAENGVKLGFRRLMEAIDQAPSPRTIATEEYRELRNGAVQEKTLLAEEFLGAPLPLTVRGGWDRMAWEAEASWLTDRVREEESYFFAEGTAEVKASGMLRNFKPRRRASLTLETGILAGRVPLALFPLLIDRTLSPGEKDAYLEDHGISFEPASKAPIVSPAAFSGGGLIPDLPEGLLSQALKIKFFTPGSISLFQLRKALGLEEADEPVPEGVYLIKDDLGLGGVYVEGDVTELGLAISGDNQVISFRTGAGEWLLKFSPAEGKTVFQSPVSTQTYNLVPLGIIVVSGKILSLGGGRLDREGRFSLSPDDDTASLLRGVNLSIVSEGEITITSHLIGQGVKWTDRVPYLKDSDSQLMIFSGGKDLTTLEDAGGGVTIGEGAPTDLKVQASITAGGKGFAIEGRGKTVSVAGGLQASDYTSQGNSLSITPDETLIRNPGRTGLSPLTRQPLLVLAIFEAVGWKDFE